MDSPLLEVLIGLTGNVPPVDLTGVRDECELSPADCDTLLEWASDNARPQYLTGQSLLDAAAILVGIYFRGEWYE